MLLRLVQTSIFSIRPSSTKLMPTLHNWTVEGLSNTLVHSAMVLGLVLFKAWQISWKKEQKLGFFPWIKNNRITFHRIFVLIWKLIFKIREGEFNFLCFVILRGFIYKLCNVSLVAPFLVDIALQVHPNFQHKFLHFEIHPHQNPRIFFKKRTKFVL